MRRQLEDDEAELAALREQDDEHRPLELGIGISRAIAQSTAALTTRKPTTAAAMSNGCASTTREVDAHADGDEEQAQEAGP